MGARVHFLLLLLCIQSGGWHAVTSGSATLAALHLALCVQLCAGSEAAVSATPGRAQVPAPCPPAAAQ